MTNPSPTTFSSAQEFLAHALKERQRKNARFSLRAWSRQLGYRNPSLLSDVLCGRRQASAELVRRIAANLQLEERDESFLQSLCGKAAKAKDSEPEAKKNADENGPVLALDKFRLISDWYHLVILELFLLKDFRATPQQILSRLMQKIPRSFVDASLARLQRLGLIQKNNDDEFVRTDASLGLFVGTGISNVAIRNHHHQMIELASEALDKQEASQRDYSGSTVCISQADLPKVRKAIYQLHSLFNELSSKPGEGEVVYQLNVQLFRIDKSYEDKELE